MKILFVAPRYHTNQHGWVSTLQNTGYHVRFISFWKLEQWEHYEALEPIVAETKHLPRAICGLIDAWLKLQGKITRAQYHYWPNYHRFKAQILQERPNLIIVRDAVSPLSLVTFWIARKEGIPAILYNQHPIEASENFKTRLLQRLGLVPRFRVTPTRTTEMEHNPTTNAHYLPLIVDFSFEIKDKTYQNNQRLNILSAGKLSQPRKRLRLLVQALAILRGHLSFHLTIVGALAENDTDEYQRLVAEIKALDLSDHITIKKNVPYEEMQNLYRQHDIFVLPSINEPYAISPLEAMAFGLPVILTESNGARGIIDHGSNGEVIPNDDVSALAQAITQYNDINFLKNASNNAYQKQQTAYGPATFLHRFTTLLSLLAIK